MRDWQAADEARRRSRKNLKVVSGASRIDEVSSSGFKMPEWIYRAALILICTAGLTTAAIWAARQYAASFAVQQVTIRGEFHNEQAKEIETALMPFMRGDFFTIDLLGAQTAVTQLSWVRHAGLRRQWPNRIIVDIREQVPVARWGTEELLNDSGETFRHDYVGDTSRLPLLNSQHQNARKVFEQFQLLQKLVQDNGLTIAGLSLSVRNTWSMRIDGDIVVELGKSNIEWRLQRLLDVWPTRLEARRDRITSIDLRYSNGFAVAWKTADANPNTVESKRDV
jgi:cell division protein FtsQ